MEVKIKVIQIQNNWSTLPSDKLSTFKISKYLDFLSALSKVIFTENAKIFFCPIFGAKIQNIPIQNHWSTLPSEK